MIYTADFRPAVPHPRQTASQREHNPYHIIAPCSERRTKIPRPPCPESREMHCHPPLVSSSYAGPGLASPPQDCPSRLRPIFAHVHPSQEMPEYIPLVTCAIYVDNFEDCAGRSDHVNVPSGTNNCMHAFCPLSVLHETVLGNRRPVQARADAILGLSINIMNLIYCEGLAAR